MLTPFSLFILALVVNYIAGRIRQNMVREFSLKVCQARGVDIKPTDEERAMYMPNLLVYYLPVIIALIVNIVIAIQLYGY